MMSLIWIISIVATVVIADRKKLNMAVFILLSILLGPLAMLIALLSRSSAENSALFTLSDAKQYLEEIKISISQLTKRAQVLEARIEQLSGVTTSRPSSTGKPARFEPTNDTKPAAAVKSEGFEQVFAKVWLNRIGVILFVMGVGLFISYTFQYLNALAKVAIGFAFSIAFFLWGRFLEQNKKYTKIAWGILGGAWGLLYLSTFALHYIPATRIINNPMVEVILLAAISVAAIAYNLKYRSWVVTAMTFVLAFITAGLGEMDYSSIAYFAFLVGGIAFLAYKMQWHQFLVYGIAGSYITFTCWINSGILFSSHYLKEGISIDLFRFQILFSILALSWVIYSLVFFMLDHKEERQRKQCVTGILINAGFFTFFGLEEISVVQSKLNFAWDEKIFFLITLTAAYFLFAFMFRQLNKPRMIVSNATLGFTLAGFAIFIKVPELSVAFFWILEMAMLFIIGIYYKERIYRTLAGCLSILVLLRLYLVDFSSSATHAIGGMVMDHNILIISFAAACFYVLGIMAGHRKLDQHLTKDEKQLYWWAYPLVATTLLICLFEEELSSRWISLSWTGLGTSLLGVGFFLKNRVFRIAALGVLSLASLRAILVDMSGVNTIYKIVAFMVLGALLLGISMIYSKYKIKER